MQKESETWPQAADPVYSLGLASEDYRRHDGKQPAALCATNNDSTVVPVTIIPNKKQHSLEDCHTQRNEE